MGNERIGWAVELLSPEPCERILEIGCGHGVSVSQICDRLVGGRMVAIDRSAAMIEAAKRRNSGHLAAGRLELQLAEFACAELGSARFDKAFAMRVGVFARGDPARELARLARHLSPSGRLFLIHDEPSHGAADIAQVLGAAACRNGWTVEATLTRAVEGCDVACVIARPPV
ncbi:trans-aconitate methyltransferase [Sinorhizobium kostiense]|uniref:Trans-aconitate methyltransferase n=1 Tax=Sinorhizobium kostiense TaxID=76747 RepID=A0ABS4R3A1_9HYPH|nr:methyltransferase domain-containing protein [Sinorhizobium kostiense]MBP2237169.1 trans-aconitate methyltransferase [Sinorhizobium kostiense]